MRTKLLLGLLLIGLASLVQAKEVQIKHNGMALNGNLVMADGKALQDGIILITHGTLAHNRMEITTAMQNMLNERGISSLAITLGLNIDNRKGFYDCKVPHTHKHTDALDEIGLWLDWLKQQGADNVVLLGHSRGGNQTAWFAAERPDPVVKHVVLIAPATWDAGKEAKGFEKATGKSLDAMLGKAKDMVKAGKGDQFIGPTQVIYCKDAKATAETFVSYYSDDPRKHTPNLLKKIKPPVLVVSGTADDVVKGLAEAVKPLADGKQIRHVAIEGAGHFFRDLHGEDVADAIADFIGME